MKYLCKVVLFVLLSLVLVSCGSSDTEIETVRKKSLSNSEHIGSPWYDSLEKVIPYSAYDVKRIDDKFVFRSENGIEIWDSASGETQIIELPMDISSSVYSSNFYFDVSDDLATLSYIYTGENDENTFVIGKIKNGVFTVSKTFSFPKVLFEISNSIKLDVSSDGKIVIFAHNSRGNGVKLYCYSNGVFDDIFSNYGSTVSDIKIVNNVKFVVSFETTENGKTTWSINTSTYSGKNWKMKELTSLDKEPILYLSKQGQLNVAYSDYSNPEKFRFTQITYDLSTDFATVLKRSASNIDVNWKDLNSAAQISVQQYNPEEGFLVIKSISPTKVGSDWDVFELDKKGNIIETPVFSCSQTVIFTKLGYLFKYGDSYLMNSGGSFYKIVGKLPTMRTYVSSDYLMYYKFIPQTNGLYTAYTDPTIITVDTNAPLCSNAFTVQEEQEKISYPYPYSLSSDGESTFVEGLNGSYALFKNDFKKKKHEIEIYNSAGECTSVLKFKEDYNTIQFSEDLNVIVISKKIRKYDPKGDWLRIYENENGQWKLTIIERISEGYDECPMAITLSKDGKRIYAITSEKFGSICEIKKIGDEWCVDKSLYSDSYFGSRGSSYWIYLSSDEKYLLWGTSSDNVLSILEL